MTGFGSANLLVRLMPVINYSWRKFPIHLCHLLWHNLSNCRWNMISAYKGVQSKVTQAIIGCIVCALALLLCLAIYISQVGGVVLYQSSGSRRVCVALAHDGVRGYWEGQPVRPTHCQRPRWVELTIYLSRAVHQITVSILHVVKIDSTTILQVFKLWIVCQAIITIYI